MANPNIVSTSNIRGKTDVLVVSTSAATITENAAASGKVLKINSLIVSNDNGSNPVDVSAALVRGTASFHFAKAISVPANASIVIVAKENTLYLNEGDAIKLTAGSANAAQAICSYEEIY